MRKFKDFLLEEFEDKDFEKSFYKGLEKARIAIEIAYLREKRGITQFELAKMINTSQSAIARLENLNYKSYSINTLRKIAEALDLELVITFREKGIDIYEKESIIDLNNIQWIKENYNYKFLVPIKIENNRGRSYFA